MMKSDLDYLEEVLRNKHDNNDIWYKLKQLIQQAQDIKHEESQEPDIHFDPNWD